MFWNVSIGIAGVSLSCCVLYAVITACSALQYCNSKRESLKVNVVSQSVTV